MRAPTKRSSARPASAPNATTRSSSTTSPPTTSSCRRRCPDPRRRPMQGDTSAPWQPSQRYPEPLVRVIHEGFARYRINAAKVERLATGCRWSEGPVWFGDGRYLLWSDIPNNRILRWDEETGAVGVFRRPSNFANGHTRDRQGRLLTCEHGARRVTRTEYDGSITVILDRWDRKPLNSPNDIVVKCDVSIWCSDPVFVITRNYLANVAKQELPTNLYRIDKSGRASI